MAADNLGRHVKWQDKEGGWHTGRVVTQPTGNPYPPFEFPQEVRFGAASINDHGGTTLVRESCDGKLTWVNTIDLQPWQMRVEWEPVTMENVAQLLSAPPIVMPRLQVDQQMSNLLYPRIPIEEWAKKVAEAEKKPTHHGQPMPMGDT